MSEKIRVLVVDDEPHARRGMRLLLEDEKDINVVGESVDGREAVAHIRDLRPDLVFLDVTMPDRSGLGVIEDVGVAAMPQVIFVTAYDEYAAPAFESNAVDYVLKPFTNVRFRQAIQRARERLRLEQAWRFFELQRYPRSSDAGDNRLERFTLKIGNRLKLFTVEQIDWIEADE